MSRPAETSRLPRGKPRNCDRRHEYKRVLESGGRIAQMNKNGEREFLTDEQRAREMRETQRALADCG